MKPVITLEIAPYDHPVIEINAPADESEVESMTLWLSDDICLTGARSDVERFVRDLCNQVAMREGETP